MRIPVALLRAVSVPPARLLLSLVILVAGCRSSFAAEEPCTAPSSDCAVVGNLEISASFGVGHRSNPIAGKSDLPLFVIPRISYYGKRFFLENLELGYTLHDGERNTFSLVGAPGYDRAFFVRSDLQNLFIPAGFSLPAGGYVDTGGRLFSVGKRHTTYLAGPEWTFNHGWITGQLDALREVTNEHQGYEVRAAMATPIPVGVRSSLVASAGFTWKSQEIVRYYYGVSGLYTPGAAFNPFIKLKYSRPLTDRWSINAFAHYEQLDGAISNSPVVNSDHVTTVFAGVAFRVR